MRKKSRKAKSIVLSNIDYSLSYPPNLFINNCPEKLPIGIKKFYFHLIYY